MSLWVDISMIFSIVASLILITEGFLAMVKLGSIKKGFPILFFGLVISFEGAMRFVDDVFLTPLIWGIETLFLAFVFIWIIILLGGKIK